MQSIVIEKQTKEFYYKHLNRTGLGDYYFDMDNAQTIVGKVGNRYIAYIIYFEYKNQISVCYQNIKEKYTKPFLDLAFNMLKEENIYSIVFSTDLIYESNDFKLIRDDTVYRIEKSAYPEYERLLSKYQYILDSLKSKDYILKEYSEEYNDQIIQIYKEHVKTDNTYMLDCMNGKHGQIIKNLSFVVLKNDILVSYIIITFGNEQDNSVMLRYLMAKEEYRHTGVMLMPLQKFLEAFYASDYKRARFTIEMKNKYSKLIVPKFPNLFELRLNMREYKYYNEEKANLLMQKEENKTQISEN